jgi:NhaP-type Na+/H+ or K+/H+ antiporter
MSLSEQILSIIFSFLYGVIIFILYRKFYRYLYTSKKIYSFFNSLLFLLDLTLVYFISLYKINSGIIDLTFLIITISTFLILVYTNLQKKCQDKSKRL